MPNRELREGILTSERVNALSFMGEIFYRRLISVVDDFGRFHAHTTLLKAACYPLRLDDVKESDIASWLEECARVGLIVLYAVNGKKFLELQNFRNRKRALHSKFPPAESTPAVGSSTESNHVTDECPADIRRVTGMDLSATKLPAASASVINATRSENRFTNDENDSSFVATDGTSQSITWSSLEKLPTAGAGQHREKVDSSEKKKQIHLADEEFVAALKANPAYERIDIDRELHKARAWLMTPRGKGKRLTRAFVVNWLNRVDQPLGAIPSGSAALSPEEKQKRERLRKEDEAKHRSVAALADKINTDGVASYRDEMEKLLPAEMRLLFGLLTVQRRNEV